MTDETSLEPSVDVHGHVVDGFDAVRDAFACGFDEGGGAAFSAWVGGERIVDLWGGTADARVGSPWREDTLQLIFSGTKGLVAACVLVLVDRGEVNLDAEVRRFWPDFAQAGKGRLTVAELLSHRAGLAAVATPVEREEMLDPDRMAAVLAKQEPFRPDGGALAYHALTFGWLCHGLVRAVTGTTLGALFREAFAVPLGLDIWIGLPEELEPRVSTLTSEAFPVPQPVRHAEYGQRIFGDLFAAPLLWNERAWHGVEVAAVNGIATARDVAKLYSLLAGGGELNGRRVLSEATVALARRKLSGGLDAFFDTPFAFSCGFELQATDFRRFGPEDDVFGHTGAGGSIHGAWPGHGAGFSYCMNDMRDEESDDRGRSVLRALKQCLDARGAR